LTNPCTSGKVFRALAKKPLTPDDEVSDLLGQIAQATARAAAMKAPSLAKKAASERHRHAGLDRKRRDYNRKA
jgi:hypothetical protein